MFIQTPAKMLPGSLRDELGVGPAVEASGEPFRLFAHQGAEQLPGHLRLLGAKALDVDLENGGWD